MTASHTADEAIYALATARHQYSETNEKLNFYYSGAFYFAFFQSPIHSAETDAEGKFVIEVPKQGSFVIAARAERSLGEIYILGVGIPKTERYYWLQPVSLEDQQQSVQNLSNNNLTSTTGTSSLVHTHRIESVTSRK